MGGAYGKSKRSRDFCLPDAYKAENIFGGFRDDAIVYFTQRRIKWHSLPHLRCSQTSCVNFWFGMMHEPENLAAVLRAIGYGVKRVLPFELDSIPNLRRMKWRLAEPSLFSVSNPSDTPAYLAFEWIGERNYLQEPRRTNPAADHRRTRGSNFTAVDVAVRFERTDGTTQIVLVEWKYTEKYPNGRCIRFSEKKTDRLSTYAPELAAPDCQITLGNLDAEDLFYNPFDQMMRHQLLASAMERAKEMGAAIVSYLHIGPRCNAELMERITSPALRARGTNIHDVWASLVRPGRFHSLYIEDLLPIVTANTRDRAWATYLADRFSGMR